MNESAKSIDELRRSTDTQELLREYRARLRLLGELTGAFWSKIVRAEMADIEQRIAQLQQERNATAPRCVHDQAETLYCAACHVLTGRIGPTGKAMPGEGNTE